MQWEKGGRREGLLILPEIKDTLNRNSIKVRIECNYLIFFS